MGTQKIHRIYTEDFRRKTLVRALSKKFASFTLQSTTGYYAGKAEKSIVLEIVGAGDAEIRWVAEQIRKINQQSSVLVVSITGRAKKVTANRG
jgi:hypothetical protein